MNIACIAWGSLLWNPGPLKLASPWRPDGPLLPLEFVRDSDDSDELALVLHAPAPPQPTWWALLATSDIDEAREMLRQREKIRPAFPECVGSIPHPHAPVDSRVAAWLAHMKDHGVDAAVWTALPAKFAGASHRAPSAGEAVAFLDGLTGDVRANAENYVRQIPRDIRTPYRAVIEERLGWTPRS